MKRLLLVACVVAGVAAGLAVGWLLAPKATTQPPAIEAAEQPSAARPAPGKPAPELAKIEQPKADAPDFAALVAKYRPATVMSGGGEFTGRVTLADGRPVEGVEIRCTPYLLPIPDGLTLEAEVEAFARKLALEEAGEKTVRTAGDGSYRVAGLDESARYEVKPRKEGYEFTLTPHTPARFHTPGREINFTAKAVVWVKADVRMPDGTQAEVAQIALTTPASPHAIAYWSWTPVQPSRAFELGSWTLEARGGKHNEYAGSSAGFYLEAGKAARDVTFHLVLKPAIAGRVKFPASSSSPVPQQSGYVRVMLEREDGGEISKTPERRFGPGNSRSVFESMPDFIYVNLEPGKYILSLKVHDKVVHTRDVDVADGLVEVELQIPEPDPADYIVVRVHGPEGPVTGGMYFSIYSRRQGGGGGGTAQVFNRGSGEYWVARSKLKQGDGYEHTLTATSETLGERTVKLVPDSAEPIEISFAQPGYIAVEIAGYDEHPQRAQLKTRHWRADKEPRRDDFMDWMGRERGDQNKAHRIGPLEPGEYVVALFLGPPMGSSQLELDRKVVVVGDGEVQVRLLPPTLHSLVITIPDEYRSKQLTVSFSGNPAYRFLSSMDQSEFAVGSLRPGDYHIVGPGAGQMTVSVPVPGGRVEFKPLPFNAFRVREWGRPRDGKDVGLKAGDIVLQIDGQSLEDRETRNKVRAESLRAETTTWTVLRGGVRMNVTFKGSDLNQSGVNTEETRYE